MLQLPSRLNVTGDYSPMSDPEQGAGATIDLHRMLGAARRQAPLVAGALFASLVLGFVYLMRIEPLYTADSLVLIDNRRIRAVESSYDVNNTSSDAAASLIDNQVEVIKAEKISARVVRSLGLLDEPEFQHIPVAREGAFLRLRRFLNAPFQASAPASPRAEDTSDAARLHWAALAISENMDIRRVARTMVLQISYTSPDAGKAARFANAYAEAYLADQLDAKYEATRLASHWLEERLAELKKKALDSDLAVQRFREERGLISSGGRLVKEQQLSEINTQLVTARGETAKAQARYQRLAAIIQGHQTDAIVSEAIGNITIEQMRGKYLDASKRYSEIVAKLGPDHLAAVGLKNEMNEYEKLMFEELARLAEGYRSEVEIAQTREQSLTEELQRLVGLNAAENKALVTLRELEREGETYRNLYQTYLQRYNEALQQQSFPIIEARIITTASAPTSPSHPKKLPILLLFGLLGGAAGTGVGFFRELREKGFHSEEQVHAQLGLECLGILPTVTLKQPFGNTGPRLDEAAATASETAGANANRLPANHSVYSYSLLRPGSGFSETLLASKLAADVTLSESTGKVIGSVSVLPGEGKSVFSKNFASLLAHLGQRTLLIDADLRVARLTKEIAPAARGGLVEAAVYKEPIESLVMTEEDSGLYFLPCVIPPRMSHTSNLLASKGMHQLLQEARKQFDYIILDLPPLGPVVDARAIAPQVHAFVFIVEWRRVARRVVQRVLDSNPQVRDKCIGVVLNKVNMSELRLYQGAGSHYQYYDEYAKSYYLGV